MFLWLVKSRSDPVVVQALPRGCKCCFQRTASAEPGRAGSGEWKVGKTSSCASALVMEHESHQPLLGSKLSFHGWHLEINAFLTDKLNKQVQRSLETAVDLPYGSAKPILVLKVHQEITPEARILSFCHHFLLQIIQTTLKLLAGNN